MPPKKTVGGLAFFSSLFALALLSIVFITVIPQLIDSHAFQNSRTFLMGAVIGVWLSHVLIKGHTSVFLHELKHSIISNFAGNRSKGMKIGKNSGYYIYEYSKRTESYNALIALAPYFFPLFTIIAALFAFILWSNHPAASLALIGAAFGGDLLLNIKDIGPHQSDIRKISGGYSVGLLFIAVMNLTIALIILAWVFQGMFGLKFLLHGLWEFMIHIVAYYRTL